MSPSYIAKDLLDKYGDEATVKDLVTRKIAAGQYEPNPDFPDNEDSDFVMQ